MSSRDEAVEAARAALLEVTGLHVKSIWFCGEDRVRRMRGVEEYEKRYDIHFVGGGSETIGSLEKLGTWKAWWLIALSKKCAPSREPSKERWIEVMALAQVLIG